MKQSEGSILECLVGRKNRLLVWQYILEWQGVCELKENDIFQALEDDMHKGDIQRGIYFLADNNIINIKDGKVIFLDNELNKVSKMFFKALVNHNWEWKEED